MQQYFLTSYIWHTSKFIQKGDKPATLFCVWIWNEDTPRPNSDWEQSRADSHINGGVRGVERYRPGFNKTVSPSYSNNLECKFSHLKGFSFLSFPWVLTVLKMTGTSDLWIPVGSKHCLELRLRHSLAVILAVRRREDGWWQGRWCHNMWPVTKH